MVNKKFENKENGNVVVIRQDDGVWFTLTNGAKIKKDSFFNKYSEVVDPIAFFNNSHQGDNISSMAIQLSNMDTSQIVDNTQETIVQKVDESTQHSMPQSNISKQQMVNDFIEKQKNNDLSQYKQVDEDTSVNQLVGNQPPVQQRVKPIPPRDTNNPNYPEFQNVKRDRDNTQPTDYYNQQPPEISDPSEDSYKFFRGFKKNHKITIELNFDEYIADPEFLKLMMDNFEADVIKFYTMEIFKNVVSNPQKVENDIYNQLEDIILNKRTTKKKPPKRTERIIPKVSKEDRVQIKEDRVQIKEDRVQIKEGVSDTDEIKLSEKENGMDTNK